VIGETLASLNTDCITLYQLHRVNPNVDTGAFAETLASLNTDCITLYQLHRVNPNVDTGAFADDAADSGDVVEGAFG
jgi:aryl-alcohol dehydrogenase-like predicted oxidoreductase